MKIAFDAKRAFRNRSGLGNYSRTTIRHLSFYYPGNEYMLLTPDRNSIEPDFPPADTEVYSPGNIFYKTFKGFWRSYGTGNLLRNEKPDIYHGLSNELPFNIRSTGIKSIVTIHDLIFLRFPHLYKPIDRSIYLTKFRFAAKNADLVIAVSEQTKKDIIQYLDIPEIRVKVVYQSGNPIFSSRHSRSEINALLRKYDLPGEYILCVGTIEERKNQLEIIRALDKGKIDIPLVLAGRYEKKYMAKINSYIAENKIGNIYFLSGFPTEELPALYQGARLFVYPSSFEGFGIPVLEAIQSGVPVIAGAGHCLEETGGPDTRYIDPADTENFSVSIKNILDNADLREKMILSGLEYSKQFNPEITVKTLHQTYESIL